MKTYDPLWEEHPKVKQIRAESIAAGKALGIAEGKALGIAEGKVQTLQSTIVDIVKVRFPELTEFAEQQVTRYNDPGGLALLVQKVLTAPDESTVRFLLSSPAA